LQRTTDRLETLTWRCWQSQQIVHAIAGDRQDHILHCSSHAVISTVVIDDCFGPRLRRERERRQISLASISANTKISLSLLQGLERDDVSRWPHGIFRRSFVRDYATAIGLDPEDTVREFQMRFPDPADAIAPATVSSGAHLAHPPQAATAVSGASPGDTALRLTLADTSGTFARGSFLPAVRTRCAAAACDLGVIAVLGLVSFIALGRFWLPVAVSMAVYYVGGILLLGNTPGVCMFAPGHSESSQGTGSPTSGGPTVMAEEDDDAAILPAGRAWASRSAT
jgi:transcriptional regulator with XRE-family HTH domain